jgi:RNA polymerase sigma-70 factor (ECF subfamily)
VDRARSRVAGAAAVERLAVRDATAAADSPAEAVVLREEGRRVLEAMAELPAVQRDAVLMAYGRGLTAAEIARAAGVPVGTAKSRVRLGLARIREAVVGAPEAAAVA